MRAAIVEEPLNHCAEHGFWYDGWEPQRCSRACHIDVGEEPCAGETIEDAIFSFTYEDRDNGTRTYAIATAMRKAKRHEMNHARALRAVGC
jgi:hypothetical protein